MEQKTLYISDMDGTLLSSGAVLSDFSRETLNMLIGAGMHFSVATARSPATAGGILSGVPLEIPAVLLNGVCLYNILSREYVNIEYIPEASGEKLAEIIRRRRLSGFMFTVEDGIQNTYFENTDSPNALQFIEERRRKYGKHFFHTEDFALCIPRGSIYYSISDTYEKLCGAYEEMIAVSGLRAEFYRDVYNRDFWYLEVCSADASKYRAALLLKKLYGFARIVGFGDNLNDLPLFDACDECYAPENANPEVIRRANGIIPSNNEDGVVKKLISLYENK